MKNIFVYNRFTFQVVDFVSSGHRLLKIIAAAA